MDLLLSSFVKAHVNMFNNEQLKELETFLKFEDETILNYFNHNIGDGKIENNNISKIFKNFKV